jgi:hypothetical protein
MDLEREENTMEVYKVVRKLTEDFWSGNENVWVSIGESAHYRIVYEVGKRVIAEKGTMGIFCFKILKDAQNFKVVSEQIFKAEGHGNFYRPKFVCQHSTDLHKFNKLKQAKKSLKALSIKAPQGTLCFSSITIKELVV